MAVANVQVTQILFKRGNVAKNNAYVGALSEVTHDTTLGTLRIHDGVTPGGYIMPTQANVYTYANLAVAAVLGNSNVGNVSSAINTINANVTAANAAIVAISANLGAFETYANLTFGTSSYGDSNVASYLPSNPTIIGINANVTAANTAIVALQSNAASQAVAINTIDANLGTATTSIISLTSNAASQATAIAVLQSNAAVQAGLIDLLSGNAASQSQALVDLTANAAVQSAELSVLLANASVQATELNDLMSNAAVQADELNTLISNAAVQATAIDTINANLGAFETYANLTFGTSNYGDANVAAYLPTDATIIGLTSNAASQATAIDIINANIGAFETYANLTFGTSNYGDANVAAYLPDYTGNLSGKLSSLVNGSYTASLMTTGEFRLPPDKGIQGTPGLYSTGLSQTGGCVFVTSSSIDYSYYSQLFLTYSGGATMSVKGYTDSPYTWLFGTDGNIRFPDATKMSGNTITLSNTQGFNWHFYDPMVGGDTVTLYQNGLTTGWGSWSLATGNGTNAWMLDSESQEFYLFNGGVLGGKLVFGTATNAGDGSADDIEVKSTNGNVYVTASSKSWAFNDYGTITLPGNATLRGTTDTIEMYTDIGTHDGIEMYSGDRTNIFNQGNINLTTGVGTTYKTWHFDTDGTLTFPDGTLTIGHGMGDLIQSTDNLFVNGVTQTISAYADNQNLSQIYMDGYGNVVIRSVYSNATDTRWTFGFDGNVTLPSGGAINYANGESILSSIVSTYGNTEVAAYLPTYGGNIQADNVMLHGDLTAFSASPSPIISGFNNIVSTANLIVQTPAVLTFTVVQEGGIPGVLGAQTITGSSLAFNDIVEGMTVTGNNIVGTTTVTSVTIDGFGTIMITTDTTEVNPFWYGDTYTFSTAGTNDYVFGSNSALGLPGNILSGSSQIQFVANSSGDGYGLSTLRLIPDTVTGYESQHIVIDPTYPNHIHIRAGGVQDSSDSDLFLGGEISHVKVSSGTNPSVHIRANDYDWQFGTNGILTIPTSGGIVFDSSAVSTIDGVTSITFADSSAQNTAFTSNVVLNTVNFTASPLPGYGTPGIQWASGFQSDIYGNTQVVAYLNSGSLETAQISGNLTVGNLTVNGNVTYINTQSYNIVDNIITMADGNPADTLDLGFAAHRTVGGTLQHTGLVRDASANNWKLFSNVVPSPGNTVDFANAIYDDLVVGAISSPTIVDLYANAATQSVNITSLQSNAVTQETSISGLRANVTAANATIVVLQSNIGSFYTYANATYATGTSYSNANVIAYLTTATITTTGNITAGNLATSNTVTAATIQTTGAYGNITGANVISANTVTVSTGIFWANGVAWSSSGGTAADDVLRANVGAYEIYANANIGTLYLGNVSTQANLGVVYNTISTHTTWLGNLQANVYANSNVASYLTTATINTTGNVTAGNITTAGNVYGSNFVGNITTGANITASYFITSGAFGNISGVNTIFANNYVYANGVSILTGIGGTYSNANVTAYLAAGTDATIIGLVANINAANSAIVTANTGLKSYTDSALSTINANVGTLYLGNISTQANLGAYQTWANIQVQTINANLGAYQFWNNANTSSLANSITSVTANVAAANAAITTLQANIGSFYTYANATYSTGSGSTYSNANVASYLPTYSGNIGAGNIITTGATSGNISGANYISANVFQVSTGIFWANGVAWSSTSGGGTTYTNSNVTTLLASFGSNTITTTGNITAGNIVANAFGTTATYTGNVTALNIITTGTYGNITNANVISANNIVVSGYGVQMASRPAFRIYGGSPSWFNTSNVNLKGSSIVVDYNQGNHFNSATGIFTAPVGGLYSVTLNARVGTNNGQNQIMVGKNGLATPGNVAVMWESDTNTGTAIHYGVASTIKLAAGEWLSANITVGNIQFDQNDSWTVTYIG